MMWQCYHIIYIMLLILFIFFLVSVLALFPHTSSLSFMWRCSFNFVVFNFCVFLLHYFSSFHPSCGDAVSAILSFYASWYSSNLVHHSIHLVVMLFPPHYYFKCAGTPHTLFFITSIMYWCRFCHIFSFVCWYSSHIVHYSIHLVVMLFPPHYFHFSVLVRLTHCSSFHPSGGDAVSATLFSFLSVLVRLTHCSLLHPSCINAVSATYLVLCAGTPHTLFIIPSIWWWCCFRHIIFLLKCAGTPHTLFFITSIMYWCRFCHIFSFVCWYASHIVHHSIHLVVMLFPPHYFPFLSVLVRLTHCSSFLLSCVGAISATLS